MAILWEVTIAGRVVGSVQGPDKRAARRAAALKWPGRVVDVTSLSEAVVIREEQGELTSRGRPMWVSHIEHMRRAGMTA